jgi:hypothetical protein
MPGIYRYRKAGHLGRCGIYGTEKVELQIALLRGLQLDWPIAQKGAETCVRSHERVGQSRREPARDPWRTCSSWSEAKLCRRGHYIPVLGGCAEKGSSWLVGWPVCQRRERHCGEM